MTAVTVPIFFIASECRTYLKRKKTKWQILLVYLLKLEYHQKVFFFHNLFQKVTFSCNHSTRSLFVLILMIMAHSS